MLVCVCTLPDEDASEYRECPIARVVRLPQLCRDDQLSGASGLLSGDNIAQVYP